MKLKCVLHDRRVHVLDEGKVVHREDGSHCRLDLVEESAGSYLPHVRIGQEIVSPRKVWLTTRNAVKQWRTNRKQGGSRDDPFPFGSFNLLDQKTFSGYVRWAKRYGDV